MKPISLSNYTRHTMFKERRKLLGLWIEAIEKGDKEKEKEIMDLMKKTQIKNNLNGRKK